VLLVRRRFFPGVLRPLLFEFGRGHGGGS
jgi:hypothetical protein